MKFRYTKIASLFIIIPCTSLQTFTQDLHFEEPQRLSFNINSDAEETMPIISPNGKTLYFTSEGHQGYGNADIFFAERLDSSWINWSVPVNLGNIINSSGFDASFLITPDNDIFFSSNRNTELSDIYFSKLIQPGKADTLAMVEEESVSEVEEADISKLARDNDINKIYFDLNSSYLRQDAKAALNKIAGLLREKPELKIEVAAYADSRADDNYNLWITERRAKRTIEYLVSKGIDAKRLSGNGYGEVNPAINCTECTEEQYQLNRRVEIIFAP
ncbi:MAG: OmpA family protein [Bacteroidota bacterium]